MGSEPLRRSRVVAVCGCRPQSVRLRTNGVVCVLILVVWVVLQNLGVDPFAALGMVCASGWVTGAIVPQLATAFRTPLA